ncbi:hypothetical protein COP1_030318 [Malus domestica]
MLAKPECRSRLSSECGYGRRRRSDKGTGERDDREGHRFLRPSAGKDKQPCALAAEETHVLLSRSFELSRSTPRHDFKSLPPNADHH